MKVVFDKHVPMRAIKKSDPFVSTYFMNVSKVDGVFFFQFPYTIVKLGSPAFFHAGSSISFIFLFSFFGEQPHMSH